MYKKSFKTKKKLNYTAIKDIRNLIMIIRNLFEHEKEEKNYQKPVK